MFFFKFVTLATIILIMVRLVWFLCCHHGCMKSCCHGSQFWQKKILYKLWECKISVEKMPLTRMQYLMLWEMSTSECPCKHVALTFSWIPLGVCIPVFFSSCLNTCQLILVNCTSNNKHWNVYSILVHCILRTEYFPIEDQFSIIVIKRALYCLKWHHWNNQWCNFVLLVTRLNSWGQRKILALQ